MAVCKTQMLKKANHSVNSLPELVEGGSFINAPFDKLRERCFEQPNLSVIVENGNIQKSEYFRTSPRPERETVEGRTL